MARRSPSLFLFLSLAALSSVAVAADQGRISYLEQEVRNLQRQVMALSRRLDNLDTRPDRLAAAADRRAAAPAATASMSWLDGAKWQKLERGMSELEVVSLLGPATSMREVDGGRVLLYALEIGAAGYLGGSVTFRDRVVAEIQMPVLQ